MRGELAGFLVHQVGFSAQRDCGCEEALLWQNHIIMGGKVTPSLVLATGQILPLALPLQMQAELAKVKPSKIVEWLEDKLDEAHCERMARAAIKFNKDKPCISAADLYKECGL